MKQNNFFVHLFFFAILIFDPALLAAQNASDSLSKKIESIFSTFINSTGPGCAVSVIRNDTVVFSNGFGMSNLEYDIPITTSTVFDIASVSKQFAGMAISTLIQ